MFNFNKRLVVESKDMDIKGNVQDLRTFVMDEKDRLTAEITELKTTLPTLTHEKATELYDRLTEEVASIRERVMNFTHEIEEKYNLTSVIEKLTQELKDLSSAFSSSSTTSTKEETGTKSTKK